MQVQEAAEKEWDEFKAERTAGVEEISQLRERVAEESRRKTERREDAENGDAKMAVEGEGDKQPRREPHNGDVEMDVEGAADKEKEGAVKDEKKADVTPPGPGYDDDAVEY